MAIAGGLSAGSPALSGAETQHAATTAGIANPANAAVHFPRIFRERELQMIAFPLGGVGAGSISLGGRGQLRDWEVFNRPDKGHCPLYGFASIWARRSNAKPVIRVLEARLQPPYEGPSGLGYANAPGLPRLESAVFTGEYPLAQIAFQDQYLPVKVTLEAFTPWIPLDADESGLPVAVLRYRLSNPSAQRVSASISFSLDNPVGTQGRANRFQESKGLAALIMENPFLPASDPLAGSFAVGLLRPPGSEITYLRGWRGGTRWRVGPLMFWDDFSEDGRLGPEAAVRDTVGSLCVQTELASRDRVDITFLLVWHFPNRTSERCGWRAPAGDERSLIGNHYAQRFPNAWSVAEHVAANLETLEARTRRFLTAMRESTLPDAVRDAATANLSTLATTTCFRTADGAFHGFEGSNNQVGCCFGNCTHVWNYETATAHLFPSLARSLREAAFGYCTDEEGRMDFRQILPAGKEHYNVAAADGQMGQIMHLHLDWILSGDTDWLRKMWPAAKRALSFAWIPGGWDANKDGVMEGVQHNTYDVEFLGPNPLCGIWYLGALRAAEEMARALGETSDADEYHRLWQSGSRWIDANLFNGEYYIQKFQGTPKEKVARGLMSGMGTADTQNPDFQLGDGCLVDQLVGQYMADICGLGALLDPIHIRKALESIRRYNHRTKLYNHESVQRVYALNDESALLICSYDRGKRPAIPFPYFAEVMTGFEHSAAVLMLGRGMVPVGLELIADIRRRYDGERRNPWNEAECGHHYARAMASWSAIPILSGFHYHGPERRVMAMPIVNKSRFRCFWSAGTGWGTFEHHLSESRKEFNLTVDEGVLPCKSVDLAWRGVAKVAKARSEVQQGNTVISHHWRETAESARLEFSDEVRIVPGESLRVVSGK
ncbi:MAG TPA: GH116 family glycosyl-hydrolase [Candidatus Sulfotelmatobacter sp.]|nr:GH116 family glycosyl-hydrolase [Candidatus Sulfotelmatobacter sp.]